MRTVFSMMSLLLKLVQVLLCLTLFLLANLLTRIFSSLAGIKLKRTIHLSRMQDIAKRVCATGMCLLCCWCEHCMSYVKAPCTQPHATFQAKNEPKYGILPLISPDRKLCSSY
jgi:hypothetical protein